MSSFVKGSSWSDADARAPYAMIDEKRRKRMISNRESARRSRMKRQKHLEDLVSERSALEKKLHEDDQKYVMLCRDHLVLDSENKVLRAEKMRLAEYLTYLHRILANHQGSSPDHEPDLSNNLADSDRFLNPWQVYGPTQPITASGFFNL